MLFWKIYYSVINFQFYNKNIVVRKIATMIVTHIAEICYWLCLIWSKNKFDNTSSLYLKEATGTRARTVLAWGQSEGCVDCLHSEVRMIVNSLANTDSSTSWKHLLIPHTPYFNCSLATKIVITKWETLYKLKINELGLVTK